MKWKDTTSYSRDKPRNPTAWSLRLTPDVSISVVSEHIYHPGEWVMHCRPWFDTKPLDMKAIECTAEQAQAKALAMVRDEVEKLSAALGKAA